MGVTLADVAIDVRCGPGTEPLGDAFLPADGPVGVADGAATLTLTMRIDAAHLDLLVSGDEDGSEHRRSGEAHAWLVPRPRHLQRFMPARVSGGGPEAELVVDATSCEDGTVRARPAVHAVATWAAARGVMPVHAAAVARDGRALLLVGRGGRGKTTTALTLAGRGWRLIADDVCFLEATPTGTVVHGLYATAVLTAATVEGLGAAGWEGLGRTHGGKHAFRLPPELPVARSAMLGAVVTVGHGDGDPYRLTELPRGTARAAWLGAFAPALQTHGPTPAWLGASARAVREHPVARLTLGWDAGRLDDVLSALLAGGGGR